MKITLNSKKNKPLKLRKSKKNHNVKTNGKKNYQIGTLMLH